MDKRYAEFLKNGGLSNSTEGETLMLIDDLSNSLDEALAKVDRRAPRYRSLLLRMDAHLVANAKLFVNRGSDFHSEIRGALYNE